MEKEFDYNTTRKKLVLPEYGRNIQNMVDLLLSIEDRDERNKAAKTVIAVMGNMNPHLRDISDFKHKLWDHLALMADFKLDIDSPFQTPEKTSFTSKPKPVPYIKNRIKYRHYGRVLELMIEKACEIEDREEKEYLITLIANHMKKSYLLWNRSMANDNIILKDLKELSHGKLEIPADFQLTDSKELLAKPRKRKHKKK